MPTEGLTGENEKVRERNLVMKTNLGVKPLYVVNLGDGQGYYAADVGWKGVSKAQADKMTHKKARRVRDHIRQPKIGLVHSAVEPA